MFLEHAHFLRPWWLLLLIVAVILLWWPRAKTSSSAWQRFVDPHLLPFVISAEAKFKHSKLKRYYLPAFLALLALALAGPTINKIPSSSSLVRKPLVILFELSPDMLASDISPSRLKRALYKLKDLLEVQKAREVSLIAYAGDAHVVAPLTDDHKTILNLSDSLNPNLMPMPGSNLLDALKLAQDMGDNNIIIMSSSNIDDAERIKSYIKQNPMRLNFWWFATQEGAPILDENGIFKKDSNNSVSLSGLRSDIIGQMAALPHAHSQHFTPDNQDIKALSSRLEQDILKPESEIKNFYDSWFDLGPYFLALAMALFWWAYAMEGASWYLLCFLFLAPVQKTHASFLSFSRPDQRAYEALKAGDAQKAAELYSDDFSKGTAFFKAKNFEKAAEYLQRVSDAEGRYNLGNAYAHLGKIKEAIEAYEQALKLNPNNSDARHNKEVLEKLAQEQQKQEDKKQEKQEDQKDQKEQKDQENQKQENQKQEEQKQQEKQKQENQKQEQKPEDQKNSQQEQAKKEEKKLEQEQAREDSEQKVDKNIGYYLDHLEQNNNLYLKRKFLYESRQRRGEQE